MVCSAGEQLVAESPKIWDLRKATWIITFWLYIYFHEGYYNAKHIFCSNNPKWFTYFEPHIFMEIGMPRNWGIIPKKLQWNCLAHCDHQGLRSGETNLLPDTWSDLATEWLTLNWRPEANAACLIPKIS